MTREQITEQVRAFITSNFYIPDAGSLDGDSSLIEQGLVDSTGVLEVVGFLEESFNVTVADEEMVPDNFDSINRISSFVERKTQAAAS